MPKKSTGSRYTQEFKAEAVQLARSYPEKSIRQLSRELGISDQTLSNWVKQAQIDRGERQGLTTEEHEELRRLRYHPIEVGWDGMKWKIQAYTTHLLNYLPVVRQLSLTGCPPVTALAGGTPWFKRIVLS